MEKKYYVINILPSTEEEQMSIYYASGLNENDALIFADSNELKEGEMREATDVEIVLIKELEKAYETIKALEGELLIKQSES